MASRIVVPQRVVRGGFDFKFDNDPYGKKLYGLLTPNEYNDSITKLNETVKPSRSNGIDTALLATGPLLVPLAAWGVRHNLQVRKRKKLLLKAILEFNASHPELYMRWNRRPESCLTIERRIVDVHGEAPKLFSSEYASFEVSALAEDDKLS